MSYTIKGKVVHEELEGGFWGIVGDEGKWRPQEFPSELKTVGLEVELEVQNVDVMSMFMWGKTVDIKKIIKTEKKE